MYPRRRFLKTLLAGGTLLPASAIFPNILCHPKKERLGVALVGLGYYSTDLLAPALQLTQHCYLAGIVTGSPEKAKRWQQQYKIPDKNVYDYNNFDRIADNPDIDVVYVVLPPSLHAPYAVRAANAGKHVWCEKPMARTEAECVEIIRACAANKVKLSIGYRMHHEPNTQELMRYAREKPLGKILNVATEAGYTEGRSNHWKQQKSMGGGAMYDMGVYALQGARYASGEEPIAVTARHSTRRPDIYKEVDETTHFQLEFPSGAVAECLTSFGQGLNHLRVTAEKGWIDFSPFQSYSGINGRSSDGKVFDQHIPNQQAKQMDDDALSILHKKAMLVPGEEGQRDIRIVEAIYKAAASGERVRL